MNFRRKTDYNWTHPQQVEAGACWVHGWVRGREFVCECYRFCSRSATPNRGNRSGGDTLFPYSVGCMKYKVPMEVSAAFQYQNRKTIAYLNQSSYS